MRTEYPVIDKELVERTQKTAEKFWSDVAIDFLVNHRNLTPNSLVFDIGGYLGDWTAAITKLYNCRARVFEPVTAFQNQMKERFRDNLKVEVFNFGLSGHNYNDYISYMGDSSTMYLPHREDAERVQIRDISEVISGRGIPLIDMVTINGEGCEYDILERLISSRQIEICDIIQVQFHYFHPDAVKLRDQIRKRLNETHKEKYCYPFVWEEWVRR